MSKTKWYARSVYAIMALALVLSLVIVAMPMAGTVEANPGEWYVNASVTTSGNGTSWETAFKTIGEATTNASTGDTINVAAGTYDEQVVITKSLTLQGVGNDTIIKPSGSAKLTTVYACLGGSTRKLASIILVKDVGTDGVTVKDLKVDGEQIINVPPGDYTNTRAVGIAYAETAGTIDSVTVTNMDKIPIGGSSSYFTTEVWLEACNTIVSVEVKNCTLNHYHYCGILGRGTKLTANIHHNSVTGIGAAATGDWEYAYGIYLSSHVTGTINNNIISDNVCMGPHQWYVDAGIWLEGANASVSNNVFYNNQMGLMAAHYSEQTTVSFTNNTVNASGISPVATYVSGIYVAAFNPGASVTTTIRNNHFDDGPGCGIAIGERTSAALQKGSITATIEDNTISGWQHGIALWSTVGSVTITSNTITDNAPEGIHIAAAVNAANVSVQFNNIVGNGVYGVYNGGTGTLNATNNWWGNASGPSHDSPVTYGDKASANVTFAPWLVVEYTSQTPVPGLAITTTSPLPSGALGSLYSVMLEASGGSETYTWSMYSGNLPDGLNLSSDGLISGTPTTGGSYDFAIQVSDGVQATYKDFELEVIATAPEITTTSPLPDGIEGVPYSITLQATGGDGMNYAWSKYSGDLPGGLSLNATGVISGTPSAVIEATTSHFRVKVVSGGQVAFKDFDLTIHPALSVSGCSADPNPTKVGHATDFNVTVSGGVGNYTYSWDFGDTVGNSTAASPTYTYDTAGTYTVNVTVLDSLGNVKTCSFDLVVNPELSVSGCSADPNPTKVGHDTVFSVTVSGGVEPYTYSWDFGDTVGNSTAASPTYSYITAGNYTVNVTVTDSLGNVKTDTLGLEVGVGATLEGHVSFPTARVGSRIEPFVVKLFEPGNFSNVMWSGNRTTSSAGVFVTHGIIPDTYDISIKNWTCLSAVMTNVVLNAGETTYVYFGTIREGDCNNDDWVTGADRSILYTGWASQEGTPGYNAHADFNRDGWLTGADRSVMYIYWGQHGDLS